MLSHMREDGPLYPSFTFPHISLCLYFPLTLSLLSVHHISSSCSPAKPIEFLLISLSCLSVFLSTLFAASSNILNTLTTVHLLTICTFSPGDWKYNRRRSPLPSHFIKFSTYHSLCNSPWWAFCLQSVSPAAEGNQHQWSLNTDTEEAASLQETTKLMVNADEYVLSAACLAQFYVLLAAVMGLIAKSGICWMSVSQLPSK